MDKLDKDILRVIVNNARVPFADVAESCGVSRAAVHQRVQKMVDNGMIEGSGYHVNARKIGYSTCAYIGIRLEKGSMYKDVVPSLLEIPEITECHFTTGAYTMLIKLFARDNEHLMVLLNDKIQEIPGVVSTETLISLDCGFRRALPIE
ncbi:MAG: Lrp/AsnC ligand binding domain-containing protein [Paludibacteraceae bacterium]|nr:Lrp/AsnC ligand binding domain-containing protein [Paludibacteraceae bacterium]